MFLALKGDPLAAREVLDRVVGKPMTVAEQVDMERDGSPVTERHGILEAEMRMIMASVPPVPTLEVEADGSTCDSDTGVA